MKSYQWSIKDSENMLHTVALETDLRANRFDITVDGVPFPVKASRRHYYMGFAKHTLSVGGKTCHLLARGFQADLAVDGRFIDCQLPYVPYPAIPKFLRLYAILCSLLCLLGTIPTALLGVVAAIFCFRVCYSPFLNRPTKLRRCATATVISWSVSLVCVFLKALLFN